MVVLVLQGVGSLRSAMKGSPGGSVGCSWKCAMCFDGVSRMSGELWFVSCYFLVVVLSNSAPALVAPGMMGGGGTWGFVRDFES